MRSLLSMHCPPTAGGFGQSALILKSCCPSGQISLTCSLLILPKFPLMTRGRQCKLHKPQYHRNSAGAKCLCNAFRFIGYIKYIKMSWSRPTSANRTMSGAWCSESAPAAGSTIRKPDAAPNTQDDSSSSSSGDLPHFCCPECGKYITHVLTVIPEEVGEADIPILDARPPQHAKDAMRPAPRVVEPDTARQNVLKIPQNDPSTSALWKPGAPA